MELRGKRVLLTGASAGIGAELALQLGAAGARTVLSARRADKLASSLAGISSLPTRTGYCASKHAVHGFFKSLRAEARTPESIGERGGRRGVTLICPGAVETEIREVSKAAGRGSAAPDDVGSGQLMSAAECARQTLAAIRGDKRELLMTLPGKLLPWARLLIPGVIDRLLVKRMGLEPR